MNTQYFYCYSLQLKNFLKLQGLRYERVGIHPNGNQYWVFIRSDKLNEALTAWARYKTLF